MKGYSHLAILSALLAISNAAMLDMTEVCSNKRDGDVVSHPLNCQAYFICGQIPTVKYCEEGLHFDRARRVCTRPEQAKCKLLSLGNNEVEPLNPHDKPVDAATAVTTLRSNPIFIAIDVDTGLAVDPMEKYDAKNVECRHFGAYFMPHPYSCRRYFICAYGHLHKHKCGPGTAWNYKRQECQLDAEAVCYSRSLTGLDIDAGNLYIPDEGGHDELSTPATTTTMPSTVCFVIDTTIVTGTTGTTWNPTGTTWNPTGTTWNPTGTTWNPTGTYHTATATTAKPTTGRIDGLSADLQCPRNGEAYLPNIEDCSKYFICIAGRPVATSCPHGLYWDQNAEFCDLARNVKCYKKQ